MSRIKNPDRFYVRQELVNMSDLDFIIMYESGELEGDALTDGLSKLTGYEVYELNDLFQTGV